MGSPLLLTIGDPAGIGPEIAAKAWQYFRDKPDFAFAMTAPPKLMAQALQAQNFPPPITITIEDLGATQSYFQQGLPILPIKQPTTVASGQANPANAGLVIQSIEKAVQACLTGNAAAMITNPISKDVLYQAGFEYPGHTEYLGVLTEAHHPPYRRGPLMMLANDELRVALVTVHQSIEEVARSITREKIIKHAHILYGALKNDLGIESPHIAMAALNPHAGENGAMGDTEINIINPVAEILRADGISITNALPPDTMFHKEARHTYDAALCMYHDQGLIPIKTIDFHGTVNITMGLPIVRTSPDHGTAFSIAGQNIARPDSLIAAIKMARKIADTRHAG